MKRLNHLFLAFLTALLLAGCDVSSPDSKIPPLEGRNPEVITWVSGRQWFPATIGIVVNGSENGFIYLEANSSANKGYQRSMRLSISDSFKDWLPLDTLDLLSTALPTVVSAEYEQYRDRDNVNSSLWLANSNDRGGIRITSLEEEDGVLYAAGEFFMTPYIFRDRPDIQEIEGIFNNVRVFDNSTAMNEYFQHITALEAAGN